MGGAGFIGSHLVRRLLSLGYAVTVLDNLSTGLREHLPASGFTFWEMDVRDAAERRAIAAEHFDAIVHLAGQTTVDASIRDPYFDAGENILGTVNVLEAARASGVGRVVFALTAAAYGERQGDKGEGGVISIFTRRAVRGEGLTIYGDGGQTRDFIYAGDVADGIAAALVTEQVNTAYNLSTQTETSLLDLVTTLARIEGHAIEVTYGPARAGDIYRSVLSNARAKAGLHWHPETSLETGLRRTAAYFRGEV